jgi:hypothetical protein
MMKRTMGWIGTVLLVFGWVGSASAVKTEWRGRNTAAQGSVTNNNWFDNKAWVDQSPAPGDIASFDAEYVSTNLPPLIAANTNDVIGEVRVAANAVRDVVLTVDGKLTLHDSGTKISLRMQGDYDFTITGSGVLRQEGLDKTGAVELQKRWFNDIASNAGVTNTADLFIETAGFEIADDVLLRVEQREGTTAHFKTAVSNTTAEIKKENNGTLILYAQNQWTGRTWIHGGTLRLATDNAVSDSSQLYIRGGSTLEPAGFDCDFATLDLQDSGASTVATIDFENIGSSHLSFDACSDTNVVIWATTTLNITNFTVGIYSIRFGTDSSGLTFEQLSQIRINGAGNVISDADGYLLVLPPPELGDLSVGSVASNNTVEISWASTNTQPYEVQYREDLIFGDWQHHSYVVGVSATNVSTVVIPAEQVKEFYRVIVN